MPVFGNIAGGEMVENDLGLIVAEEWARSFDMRSEMLPGAFVVMPNHIHGIVAIVDENPLTEEERAHGRVPLPGGGDRRAARSLGAFVAGFKAATTKRINEYRHSPGQPIWQRNYYDHIIGPPKAYHAIADYIRNNPENWAKDSENIPR
jgi:putative transposase